MNIFFLLFNSQCFVGCNVRYDKEIMKKLIEVLEIYENIFVFIRERVLRQIDDVLQKIRCFGGSLVFLEVKEIFVRRYGKVKKYNVIYDYVDVFDIFFFE